MPPVITVANCDADLCRPLYIPLDSAEMDGPLPVPKPRPFPITGTAPGPRCGHTLTAIAGPEGDLSKARLVLFGEGLRTRSREWLLRESEGDISTWAIVIARARRQGVLRR
jgi:hypothetical protein